MGKAEAWYYSSLSREHRQAYHAILQGLLSLSISFPVPLLSEKELSDLFLLVRLDHPEIFYAETFRYRWRGDAQTADFCPEYTLNRKQIEEHRRSLDARIARLARPAKELSERDRLLYIHDFICRSVRYDKMKKPYSHEILGPLQQGVSVCEGIAKAVKILCDELGIWCIVAISENNPEKNIRYRHTWNVVRIGGKYYHLDATFDNSLGHEDSLRHDYFCLCDSWFFRDHEPVIFPVPVCADSRGNYYAEKKLIFTKQEDLSKRVFQKAKKGTPFLFQWRGCYLTREVLSELCGLLAAQAEPFRKQPVLSLNWPQAIFSVSFTEAPSAPEPVLEHANEEELEP